MTTPAPHTIPSAPTAIAVIGSTGLVGHQVVELFQAEGHDVVEVSQNSGVDMVTGDGLDDALAGVEVVIDVINSATPEDPSEEFFRQTSSNLASAAIAAGIGHYVVLSIVGADLLAPVAGYMRGKLLQEAAAASSGIPWTVVRSTQFHELAAGITESMIRDGEVHAAAAKIQTIASAELAAIVTRIATSPPLNAIHEVGGPQRMTFADMARTVLADQHRDLPVVEASAATYFGLPIDEITLVPHADAELGFEPLSEWLARN